MPLKLIREEETSNIYSNSDFPHLRFIERTDKFSIDNVIFSDEIPLKGVVLNHLSNNWMNLLEKAGVVQSTIIASDSSSLMKFGIDEKFSGRMIAVKEFDPIPLECIVRGYYVEESESWEEYRKHNNMYGNVLPKGLKDSQQLIRPIYTPSTKGKVNEPDTNISFADSIDVIKKYLIEKVNLDDEQKECLYALAFSVATAIRDTSIKAYQYAHNYAMERGIIIADAKLEFGTVSDVYSGKRKLVIISEAFTPDTCRFWNVKSYQVGRPQPSLDKHIIKRYVRSKLKGNNSFEKMPALPQDILEETANVYWNMLERLFDRNIVEVTSELAWDWNFAHKDILI